MSIINEALKKTEKSIQNNLAKEAVKPNIIQTSKVYLFYVLIFVVGLFLSSIILGYFNHQAKTAAILNRPKAQDEIPANQPLKPAPETKSEVITPVIKQAFTLNGIFFSNNDGYALVNNQIIREGDLVDKAKVEKITANTVELNSEGKIITLSTNR